MRTKPRHLNSKPLPVLWRDHGWTISVRRLEGVQLPLVAQSRGVVRQWRMPARARAAFQYSRRAFTLLEMLVVLSIIGFLAAVALPHLNGMTRANSMTAAIQQVLSDCSLARQLAMSRRSTVYMVFVPPYSMMSNGLPINDQTSVTNLLGHQYSAYALVSLRSVGDQPGQANAQYLTDWRPLPDGVFIPGFKFTSTSSNIVVSTNTLSGTTNVMLIAPFPYALFPYPAVDSAVSAVVPYVTALPYIAFTSSGQLGTDNDEYIPLARGHVQYIIGSGATAATTIEQPAGNGVSNPNVIHLDWLTARAKIERNQLR